MAAFTLTSEQYPTQTNLKNLFEFLSDFKNFEAILPLDKIEQFKVIENGCSFSIKGITPMTVTLAEKKPFEFILFSSQGLGKFNFNLKAVFTGDASQTGACRVELYGDMNPFIKSMAEKPLGALINTMSLKLSQLIL
ncbi:MAG TPA: hypothetical protein PL029_05310 [Bacteroidia bacterium]|nr:hypothetical protein [Bacteroidia bacterium]